MICEICGKELPQDQCKSFDSSISFYIKDSGEQTPCAHTKCLFQDSLKISKISDENQDN